MSFNGDMGGLMGILFSVQYDNRILVLSESCFTGEGPFWLSDIDPCVWLVGKAGRNTFPLSYFWAD